MQERDLSGEDLVVLFLDGKTFADATMVVALGITLSGEKRFLGFVETDTENERVLSIEPRLRKVMGYRHLPKLREAVKRELKIAARTPTTSKRKVA